MGAGFAGLTVAQRLAKAPVDITLIDRESHHLFQPLLYQVATAGLSPADIAWPIRGLVRHQRNTRVLLLAFERAEMESDARERERLLTIVIVAGVPLPGIAHIYFLISLRNRLIVMTEWLWSYVSFERGARLITGLRTTLEPDRLGRRDDDVQAV